MERTLPMPKPRGRGIYLWGPFSPEEREVLKTAGFRFAFPPFSKKRECARALAASTAAQEAFKVVAFERRMHGHKNPQYQRSPLWNE